MRPQMNMESRNKWMILRLTSSVQWCVSLALPSATASPAPSFSQGTLEQRLACTPDVFRLCSAFIPNADEITICLGEKNAELSDACRTAFEAESAHKFRGDVLRVRRTAAIAEEQNFPSLRHSLTDLSRQRRNPPFVG